MTPGLLKKMFIVVTVLLITSLIFGASSLYQLNAQLNAIKLEMDGLKAEQNRILSSYADMRKQVNIRLGFGRDSEYFITPDDPEVSAIVQEVTGGYSETNFWKHYTRLFQWIMSNVEYSLDSPTPILPESINGALNWRKDFWRMPVDTIEDKRGDCEDMAVLLASMLLNYNQRRFPTWVVGARTSGPEPKAHVAVAIPFQNNQLAIFDTASHYYTPFSNVGGFGSQDLPLAVDHWLTHLARQMPDAYIYIAFSEDFYQEFSSTEEFIDWVTNL